MDVRHPSDPLTAAEFTRVAAIARRDRGVGEGWRYASIEAREQAVSTSTAATPRARAALPDEAGGMCSKV